MKHRRAFSSLIFPKQELGFRNVIQIEPDFSYILDSMKSGTCEAGESLLAEIDTLAEEIYINRSSFIRQACSRHIDITRNVELPAIRAHYQQRLPKLF
jgi:predicted DNA-binding ribbon-helix-helix protein